MAVGNTPPLRATAPDVSSLSRDSAVVLKLGLQVTEGDVVSDGLDRANVFKHLGDDFWKG